MTGTGEQDLDGGSILGVERAVSATAVTLTLTGELDLTTLPMAEREVLAAQDTDATVILVDLSGLEFMDSSAVRLVLQADERARAAGRRLAVACGQGLPRRLFEMLGLHTRLDLVDGPEQLG